MDSVVLLHLLNSLAPRFEWRLSALHVHHGISPNANAWADFCTKLCTQHGIPLQIDRVDIAPLRDEHGIEAAARKLRHAAFARQDCDFVALAHHADDQAETLLLQLLRGAGVRGVAAMPVLSSVEGPVLSSVEGPVLSSVEGPVLSRVEGPVLSRVEGPVLSRVEGPVLSRVEGPLQKQATKPAPATLRPLLDISRAKLLEYADQHGLQWVEDESNADDRYPRNFLRHRLLPLLERRFPAYRDTLTRSARHFAEASALLDEMARQDAADLAADAPLALSLLRNLSHSRTKNLLRYWLHARGAPMPQNVQLDEMLHQLLNAREDAGVCVSFSEWEVRRYQDRIHVLHTLGDFDRELVLPWHGEAGLEWPALNTRLNFTHTQGSGISLEKLQHAPVTLRLRKGGETLRPQANAAKRSLKNLFQERLVPPWQRERLPLLYCGDELVSVVGVAVAAGFQASNFESGLVVE